MDLISEEFSFLTGFGTERKYGSLIPNPIAAIYGRAQRRPTLNTILGNMWLL